MIVVDCISRLTTRMIGNNPDSLSEVEVASGGYLGLVHTSDGIGSGLVIGRVRSVTIQCKLGQKSESEAESKARRNRRQKDQKSLFFFRFRFRFRRFRFSGKLRARKKKYDGSRVKTGRGCATVPRSLWQVLQGLQSRQQKRLALKDATKQIKLQTGMYCSSE